MVGAQPQSILPGEGLKCRTRISREIRRGVMGCNQSEPPRPNRGVEAKRPPRGGKATLCRWRGCLASADPPRVGVGMFW